MCTAYRRRRLKDNQSSSEKGKKAEYQHLPIEDNRCCARYLELKEDDLEPRPYFDAAARISNDQGEYHSHGLIRLISRQLRCEQLLRDLDQR